MIAAIVWHLELAVEEDWRCRSCRSRTLDLRQPWLDLDGHRLLWGRSHDREAEGSGELTWTKEGKQQEGRFYAPFAGWGVDPYHLRGEGASDVADQATLGPTDRTTDGTSASDSSIPLALDSRVPLGLGLQRPPLPRTLVSPRPWTPGFSSASGSSVPSASDSRVPLSLRPPAIATWPTNHLQPPHGPPITCNHDVVHQPPTPARGYCQLRCTSNVTQPPTICGIALGRRPTGRVILDKLRGWLQSVPVNLAICPLSDNNVLKSTTFQKRVKETFRQV